MMLEAILAVATLLGGIAAVWFFWDKLRDKEPRWVAELRTTAAKKTAPDRIAIFEEKSPRTFTFREAARPFNGRVTDSKREARVVFSLQGTFNIEHGHNVIGIVDHGVGDVSVIFEPAFPDTNYLVSVGGNRTIQYEIIEKTTGNLRVRFSEDGVQTVQIECKEP